MKISSIITLLLLTLSLCLTPLAHANTAPKTAPALKPSSPALSKPAADAKTPEKALSEEDSAFASDAFQLPEELTQEQPEEKDPYTKYNHVMYKINDKLDKNIAKPIAKTYNKIMPKPVNNMVNNVFRNLEAIFTFFNDALQGNIYQADSDAWRFTINSTIGIGGLFDVAAKTGLVYNYEDFGLTLAQWGWKDSNYFILPVLGPNTIRSTLGKPITYYMSIYPYLPDWTTRYALYAGYLLNQRVQLLRYQNVADNAALDPYVFMRNAYLQRQRYLIQRNHELDNPNTAEQTRQFHNPYYLYQ
jgi:phospholipid-binding lipoprotein MlaA